MTTNYTPITNPTLTTVYSKTSTSSASIASYRDASGVVWLAVAAMSINRIIFFSVSGTDGIIYTNQTTITASTNYTLYTGTQPRKVIFYRDSSGVVWLVCANGGDNTIGFFAVSGTNGIIYTNQTTITASTVYTHAVGTAPFGVDIYRDSSGVVWIASADFNGGTVSFFSVSGTDGIIYTNQTTITASTRYTVAISSAYNVAFYRDASGVVWLGSTGFNFIRISGTDGIIYTNQTTITASTKFTRSGGSDRSISFYRDASGVVWLGGAKSGSSGTALFCPISGTDGIIYTNQTTITASTVYSRSVGNDSSYLAFYRDDNSIVWLAASNGGSSDAFFFPVSGTDGIIYTNQATITASTGYTHALGNNQGYGVLFYKDASSIVWLMVSTLGGNVAFFQVGISTNVLNFTPSNNYFITADNVCTITSLLDYFVFGLSILPRLFLQNYAFGYTRTADEGGTLLSGNSIRFTTATADLNTGILTIASGATLRIGKKTAYTVSLIFQSGSTIEVYPDTDRSGASLDLRSFTINSGTTINAVSGTVTVILSSTTGITAGSGVTLQTPQASIAAANFAQNTRVQVARLEPFTVPSTAITTGASGIITIASNRFKSATFPTLVYFQLQTGATVPTSSPQIADGKLYYVVASGTADGLTAGQFKLSLTQGGTPITFGTQGGGNFTLTGITELDNSLAGSSGYSLTLNETSGVLLRVTAQYWQNTTGCTATLLYQQNFVWNATSGITIADTVNVSSNPDTIHNSLIGDLVKVFKTTVNLPTDGSTVTGVSFNAQGVISLDPRSFTFVAGYPTLTPQAAYLYTVYYRSTQAGVRLIANQFSAQDNANFLLTGLTLDNIADGTRNTPNTPGTLAGGYLQTFDGSNPVGSGSGALYVNADTRGVAVITTSGSTIAPTQQQIRDALALSTAATVVSGSIDSKLAAITKPIIDVD